MRFPALLVVSLLAPSAVWAQDGVPYAKALEMAASEQITDVQEYWFNPDNKFSGVEGFGADGEWHEVVLDAEGNVIRSGVDHNTTPAVSLGEAADVAMGAGIVKLAGVSLSDGRWVVEGWNDGDAHMTVFVDGTSGEIQ